MRTRNTGMIGVVSVCVLGFASGVNAQNQGHQPDRHPLIQRLLQHDRIELNAENTTLPLTITESGSYVFTSDLHASGDGIYIASSDVTIDLNGYTLHGSGGESCGIAPPELEPLQHKVYLNIEIKNGGIEGFGEYGILATRIPLPNPPDESQSWRNVIVRDMRIRDTHNGILIARLTSTVRSAVLIEGCVVTNYQARGIFVEGNGRISNCIIEGDAREPERGNGIFAKGDIIVSDCVVSGGDSIGIRLIGSRATGCEVSNCVVGVLAQDRSLVEHCTIKHSGWIGVWVDGRNITVLHNVIMRSVEFGISFNSNARSSRVYNNILLSNFGGGYRT